MRAIATPTPRSAASASPTRRRAATCSATFRCSRSPGDIGEAPWDRTEQFSHDAESAEVGKYAVTLENSDIDVELFAATRSAGMTFDFPEAEPAQVILDAGGSKASVYDVDLQVDGSTVTGAVTTGGFCGKDNQHTTHFVMEFDTAVEDFGTWQDGELRPGEATASGQAAGAWLTFPAGSEVTVKSSISYVDAAGAAANPRRGDPRVGRGLPPTGRP